MNYKTDKDDIILFQKDFDIEETLDCGQAFRWVKTAENTFSGYYLDHFLEIQQKENDIFVLKNTSEEDMIDIWKDYFDLETDYSELKKRFSENKILADACSFAPGIRLLKQDPWETLCSFIISQNNNIPRIKGIINRLCEKYGGFPSPGKLSEETPESLDFLRSGFRAPYIIDAAKKVSSGEIDFKKTRKMSYEDAKKELMKIKGVGPKVADCVLLFGMHRTEAFPVDVWIKRVTAAYFPGGMPECTKGFEGTAQQYLFHYFRNHPELVG